MSFSSVINSPQYSKLSNFLNETTYTLTNLFEPLAGVVANIPANDGTTTGTISVLQIATGGIETITIPAGTYNLTMKARIHLQTAQPSNITYGALVVYDAVDPTVETGKLFISSSVSFVQSVNSALTYANINETQRIVLTSDTIVSMYFEYSNSVGTHTVVTGIVDNIDYTPSITFRSTI